MPTEYPDHIDLNDEPCSKTPENRDTGLLAILMILRFHQYPADLHQIKHDFALNEFVGVTEILRISRYFGLKSRSAKIKLGRLQKIPVPAIIPLNNGDYAILAGVSDDQVLLHDLHRNASDTLTIDNFQKMWTGQAILLVPREKSSDFRKRFDFSWFVPELMRHRRLLAEVLLISFFVQLLGLASPLFFQLVIDKVLVNEAITTLTVLALGLLAVSVFETVFGIIRGYILAHTASRIDVVLGTRAFAHLVSLPLAYFSARQAGQTVARIQELETIRSFLTGQALEVVLDVLFAGVFFGIMYLYSPLLTMIVLLSIPVYVLVSLVITPILRRRIEEKFNRGASNQTFLVESVFGVETLKAMAVEPQMQRRWESQLSGYVRANFKAQNLSNIGGSIVQLVNKLVTVCILWIGASAVISGALTVGQLIAFNMFASRVSAPIIRLAQLWQDFQEVGVSVERLADVLNATSERGEKHGISLEKIDGRIDFENVSFRYSSDTPEVLKTISFSVSAGEVVGIVGPSGSGKSTVAKLIQRLYVPERGRVLIDGMDLGVIDPRSLRRKIGVVLQESVLFHRTIRENIALADPGTSLEEVMEAAKQAGAHEFIIRLPKGYDTLIEERGGNLSGGQRQRIAIARALVTSPRILIFDEATSALDYESEFAIQQNMEKIVNGRTVIIIAHRLAAIRNATKILTIENGMITEQGTHDELLKIGGRYASLFNLQSHH